MRALAAFAVLMLVAACQAPPAEMTETERDQIETEVVALMESALEGVRQLDVDMVMATCHPTDLGYVWSSVPRGYDRVRELWVNWFENKEAWAGGWTETTVKVLNEDAAVFQGIYEATVTYEDGRIARYPANASWTSLVERTTDGWKITMLDGGAGTILRMDLVYGVYDMISFLGEDWNTPDGPSGTYELMADGNSVLTISVPGQPQEVTEVEYSIGDRMVDGCFTWGSTDEEGNEYGGTICDGVFTVDGPDGIGTLQKRQ